MSFLPVKTDCFAYCKTAHGAGRCTALTRLWCRVEKCSFYKTRKQLDEELEEIERRKKSCKKPSC